MSDKENDVENLAIDPPDNQGGGKMTESSGTETAPIDPPDNQGGGN
ncbi:MAG TPA: hypothetical protein VFR51_05500 [Pyrinomonadaceae bacterium]|nr:hypothetical protein [Pyrinomonadaceae bacterium]